MLLQLKTYPNDKMSPIRLLHAQNTRKNVRFNVAGQYTFSYDRMTLYTTAGKFAVAVQKYRWRSDKK